VGASSGRVVHHSRRPARVRRRQRGGTPRLCIALVAVGVASVVSSGPATAGEPSDQRTFCRTAVTLIQHVLTEDAIPDEHASSAKVQKFQKRLRELFDRAERSAPAEIVNEVSFASELGQFVPRTADLGFFVQILEPLQAVKRFVADNCGFKTVAVTAREYEFRGIPNTLVRGTVVFELRNEGAEVHELAFGRIRGDASLKAILALPAEERDRLNKIEELGAGAIAVPGGTDVAIVTFTKPGRYSVACFVPGGTTTIESPTEGPPHTDNGMFDEFEVKRR
jgi:uncharacterized cupredoxin-like copper-binding protein